MKSRGAPLSERAAREKRFAALAVVAKGFKSFRPASEVLTLVRAVPTIFPRFDLITRVGGLPIERFSLLHGPSTGGKTYWAIGLMLSFLMKDHFAVLIDAERTTPMSWLKAAMGDYAAHPFFLAERPKTYEDTVEKVRHFVNQLRTLREAGKVKDDTTALIVVDSIRKLIPKDQFNRIMRESRAPGAQQDKVKDRSAQIKAAMNSAWLDELVPLLEETQSAMVVIARETEDPDNQDPRAKRFGTNVKVGGGKALYYDASMDMRSSRVKSYGKKVKGSDGSDRVTPYGDVHRLDIVKSKVSGKGEDFRESCLFHISNGVWVPAGFDIGRDLVQLARQFDVISGTNSLAFGSHKWRSEDLAVRFLHENPRVHAEVEAECRALFKSKMLETRP